MSKQALIQKQTQTLNLTPQQIQLMKLIEVPTMELAASIKEEMESNPALEVDDDDDENLNDGDNAEDFDDERRDEEQDDMFSEISEFFNDDDEDEAAYKYSANNTSPDDERYETPVVSETSFTDTLLEQISFRDIDERKRKLCELVIGYLDDSGYLKSDAGWIANDLLLYQNIEVTEAELNEAIDIVKDLDPAGIGASSLQECLLIQLRRLQEEDEGADYSNAINIIENYFNELSLKHYDKITSRSGMSGDELKDALKQIRKLNPKPGGTTSSSTHNTNHVIPDFVVYNDGDDLELSLNRLNEPRLHISKDYLQMLKDYAGNREAMAFVKNKLESAKTFIEAVRQRKGTLEVVIRAIMDYQRDYFMTGDESKLRPMILKDIADIVKLDVSTISRVANSKYVQTAYGTFPLKFFFSEGIVNDEGEEVSTRAIKQIIKECVDNEDKTNPLTDDELTAVIKERGFTIARRTTAKYREQLGIQVSRLRREI
ncbi:MAG: RNA polymerase factor sigma-54 [Bacteroidales bacterium]|nr:RNA polymerase factor sigma-54 [Bacteroidales bacterium]